MRRISILIFVFLISILNIFGQNRTITGKVINENLEVVPQVRIQNSDTLLLGTTDINGQFRLEIPADTKTLLIGWVSFEWTSLNLTPDCNQLDIILMANWTYDYISLKKVNRLRTRRFKKLAELHLTAYQKNIFTTDKSCYEQAFIPAYTKRHK